MSFNIAISGLNATNQQLDTISNNIANVSTTGFKESRTEFSSIYNGGQAGGVEVAATTQNFDLNGSLEATGRDLDLAVSGDGFFSTVDSKGQYVYTRAGSFSLDKDNFIVSNVGNKLQGHGVDADANLELGNIGDLSISTSSLAAEATSNVKFIANFDSRAVAIDTATTPFDAADPTTFTSSYTTQVYDSLGNSHSVSQYFINTAANTWEVQVLVDGGDITPTPAPAINFNTDGTLDSSTSTVPMSLSISTSAAGVLDIEIDLSGSTQYGADFAVSTNNPDGYTSGEFTGIGIEDNGMIFAYYNNGQSQLQGQLILADFPNPTALAQNDDTSWTQTYESGSPVTGVPSSGLLGSLTSGSLEGSNVDLTSELVSLMTAQRNYQANTKVVSTSDQLTQALFNAV